MSILSAVLLVLAAAVVAGAEWPRIARALGAEGRGRQRGSSGSGGERRRRTPGARPGHLRVVKDVGSAMKPASPTSTDTDDFVESVRRDLDRLPTFDRDAKRDS